MKRNKKIYFLVVLLLILISGATYTWIIFDSSDSKSKRSLNQRKPDKSQAVGTQDGNGQLQYADFVAITALMKKIANADIEFYGKVIDQDGKPVAGAVIEAEVTITMTGMKDILNTMITHLGNTERKTVTVESDANGCFSIIESKGSSLDIKDIRCSGYMYEKNLIETIKETSFPYGLLNQGAGNEPRQHKESDPIVFNMWRVDGLEEIVCRNRNSLYAGVLSGKRIELNALALCTNKESTGKGIQIQPRFNELRKSKDKYGRDVVRYSFDCKVWTSGGGVQICKDSIPFNAPENGYTESINLGQKFDDPQWDSELRYRIYYSTQDGNYGTCYISVTLPYPHGSLSTLESQVITFRFSDIFVNPHGSRNLAYDPEVDNNIAFIYQPEWVARKQKDVAPRREGYEIKKARLAGNSYDRLANKYVTAEQLKKWDEEYIAEYKNRLTYEQEVEYELAQWRAEYQKRVAAREEKLKAEAEK
jgi:hypothetical protein